MRRSSSLATTSVPKRDGTLRPAACAPVANSPAAPERPSAETSRASSCAIVTGASGRASCFGAATTGAGASTGGGGAGGACAGSVTTGSGATGGCTGGSGGASRCWRSKARFSSACAVNVSFARKDATSFAPIRPAAVTARISGVAHDAGFEEEAVALAAAASTGRTATARRRRPTARSHRPG